MFALVDCNSFYCSCEAVFQPRLWGKPVVVLSNNDGCVIARSPEAKAAGIPMGAPAFLWREQFARHGVEVFSSNYELYGDMSARVMQVLHHEPPEGTAVAAGESACLGAGSAACLDWIRAYRPDYVFSGHLHRAPFADGGSWAALVPETGTWCFNPGRRETGCCLIEVDTQARQARWFRDWMAQAELVIDLGAITGPPRRKG